MREWFALILSGLVVCAGCAGRNVSSEIPSPVFDEAAAGSPPSRPPPLPEPVKETGKPAELIVTPEDSLIGKVVRYNDAGRFVVVNFLLGRTPQADQRMFVYRQGLKVGEVKVSEWQRENLIVADLTAGEAREGDEVRSK